jgi:5-formyltetrahydrofolate cyclo-ligase
MALPEKTDLRIQYLQKRNALVKELRSRLSAEISQRATRHPAWREAGTILIYVSFGSEVDTRALLLQAFKEGKRVAVPLGTREHKRPVISELKNIDHLAEGPFQGILEPAGENQKRVDPSEIDLVLVPGVAFDRQGTRLGLGGGFYDRLLPKIPEGVFAALAFSAQLSEKPLPREAHDVAMHAIVTEKEWAEVADWAK